jgi:hypothetical protein
MAESALIRARAIVAAHLDEAGRSNEAALILRGGGDDFPEMLVAVRAVREATGTIGRLERALDAYADEDFWGDGDCHAALAFHDQGAIARATLAGQDPLALPAG